MIDESDSDNSDNDSANEMDEKDKRSGRKTGNGNGSEKPTEEHVERLEEKLEAAEADQKNLFLIIFQVYLTFHLEFQLTSNYCVFLTSNCQISFCSVLL